MARAVTEAVAFFTVPSIHGFASSCSARGVAIHNKLFAELLSDHRIVRSNMRPTKAEPTPGIKAMPIAATSSAAGDMTRTIPKPT